MNAGRRRAARQSCGDAPDPLIGGGALYSLTAQLKVRRLCATRDVEARLKAGEIVVRELFVSERS